MRILTDDEIQEILDKVESKNSWRGKLSQYSRDFAKSLNPKHIKQQPEKLTDEDIQSLLSAISKQTKSPDREM